MRVLVVEDNALLRHTLKFRFRMLVIRSMTQKMPKKPIIISMNIYRILRLSISDCLTRTVCH